MTTGGFTATIIAFAVAALAMVTLMFVLAAVIASARQRVMTALQTDAPRIKHWGGRILIAVGIWFLVLAAFAGFFAHVFPV